MAGWRYCWQLFTFVCLTGHLEGADTNLGKRFQTMLENLAENSLGVTEMQKYLDEQVTYKQEVLKGEGFIRELSQELSNKFSQAMTVVKTLEKEVEETYSKLGSVPLYSECSCSPEKKSQFTWNNNLKAMVNTNELCFIGKGTAKPDSRHFENNLVKTMQGNFKRYPALKWQYVGTEDGIMHIYPASINCQLTSEGFDPRLRPWYVQTATRIPKDVVVVVDRSHSMTTVHGKRSLMEIAREAAKTVIDSLNPNDKVAILQFSDKSETPNIGTETNRCYLNDLAKATPQNKENLKKLVHKIDPYKGGTNYTAAIEAAFKRFPDDAQSAEKRDKLIVFLTDGKSTDDPKEKVLDVIRDQNKRLNNRVVIMTYLLGNSDPSAEELLRQMAYQVKADVSAGPVRNGTFTAVTNPEELRNTMGRYYDFFQNESDAVTPVITVPYFDGFGLGVVASICQAVYPEKKFRGVVCVDITISDVLGVATFFRPGEESYAFIVDDRGRLMSHPLLPKPRDYTSDPIFVDMLTIENERNAVEILQSMQSGNSGRKQFYSRRVYSRGDLIHDGVISTSVKSRYFWEPVTGTNYSVCIVLSEKDNDIRVMNPAKATSFLYHRLDLFPLNKMCDYFGKLSTTERSVVKFTGTAFRDPSTYFDYAETTETIKTYNQYFSGTDPSSTFHPSVRGSVAATEFVDRIWSSQDRSNNFTIWRYIGTLDGVFRLFPGTVGHKEYDHSDRPWYLRALSNKGDLCVSPPYLDAYGAGVIMTLSKILYHGNSGKQHTYMDPVMGVVAMDFTVMRFFSMVAQYIPDCEQEDKICFVMDSAGYLVFHEDFQNVETGRNKGIERTHIIQKESAIACSLITEGYMKQGSCEDLENIKSNHFWKVQIPDDKSIITSSSKPQFKLYTVEKSNVYFGIKTKQEMDVTDSRCVCKKTVGNKLGSCLAEKNKYECPCSTHSEEFNFCKNSFQIMSDSLPPCAPPIQSNNSGNNSSMDSLLPLCYQVDCQTIKGERDCHQVLSCTWCFQDSRGIPLQLPFCTSTNKCLFGREKNTSINGGWTNWSGWKQISECSAECDINGTKQMEQTRECTNPKPVHRGTCPGLAVQRSEVHCIGTNCGNPGAVIAGSVIGALLGIGLIVAGIIVLVIYYRRRIMAKSEGDKTVPDLASSHQQQPAFTPQYNRSVSEYTECTDVSYNISNRILLSPNSISEVRPRANWNPQPLPVDKMGSYNNTGFNDYEEFNVTGNGSTVTYLPITDIVLPSEYDSQDENRANEAAMNVRDSGYISPHSPAKTSDEVHYETPSTPVARF